MELKKILKDNDYYSIFLSLRGFPLSCTYEDINNTDITNLIEFYNSHCEFYFLIIDAYYFGILFKNTDLLDIAYKHIKNLGYINLRLIEKGEKWYLE
ncbi:DUF2691 family protein [Bacillus sp. BRMEA1]|uniref:DUF2691 family protein n=1 Tax=Neobacillus endophyticus TaxID=2738405 RepID=UPI001563D41B|nr:DUF2691 family protein [Neobacillus endophyticus]